MNFLKNFKLYSAISVLGLGLSLAATILLSRHLQSELSVNRFIPQHENLYLLCADYVDKAKDEGLRLTSNFNMNNEKHFVDPLNIPDVETFGIFYPPYNRQLVKHGEHSYSQLVCEADSSFLQLVQYPVVVGRSQWMSPNEAIVSQEFASIIAGSTAEAIGQSFSIKSDEFKVIGVVDNDRGRTSWQFDVLLNVAHSTRFRPTASFNLVKMHPSADVPAINAASPVQTLLGYGSGIRYEFFPLDELYFSKKIGFTEDASFDSGERSNLVLLGVALLMLMVIGVFNFINIYMVVMMRRAREFGLKKLFGASRGEIFLSLLLENLVLVGIALFVGWLFVEWGGRMLLVYLGMAVQSYSMFDLWLSLGLLLLLSLITTLYPYVRYCYSKPISDLRSVSNGGTSVRSRVGFLFVQYLMGFCLTVASLLFMKQFVMQMNADLGYCTSNILSVNLNALLGSHNIDFTNREKMREQMEELNETRTSLATMLNETPLLSNWTSGDMPQTIDYSLRFRLADQSADDDSNYHDIYIYYASKELFDMLELELKEGAFFEDGDLFSQHKLLLNESAMELLGAQSCSGLKLTPKDHLYINAEVMQKKLSPPDYEVTGVVKDFRSQHLSFPVLPIAILPVGSKRINDVVHFSVPQDQYADTKKAVQTTIDNIKGESVSGIEYESIEESIAKVNAEDQRTVRIYSVFAGLAIIISAMGLYAISLFDIRQRRREVALHKVHGASAKEVLYLLLRKYVWVQALAIVVGIPLMIIVVNRYMENHSVRTSLSWWIFAIAALVMIAISLLTIIRQVRKATKEDIAKSMKSE